MMLDRRKGWRSQSAQSILESAVVLALISVVAVAVARGIASHSTSRLAKARDALGDQSSARFPALISGSPSVTNTSSASP